MDMEDDGCFDVEGSNEEICSNLTQQSDKMSKVVRVPGETVVELIKYWGMRDDNLLPAFVSVDANGRKRELNRKEVLDFARRFAHQLKDLGIKNGDIVCNALPNSLERVVCEFGIQFSGATSMNGQIFRSDGEDFMEALRVSRCCAVICDPSVPNGARHVLLREVPLGCENAVQSASLPHLQRLIICARNENCVEKDFITSLKDALLPQYTAKVSSSDLSTVMTTSGSTGYSKLVKLTHSNICHFGRQVKAIEEFSSGERFINCAPLGWAGGYPQWFLSCGVTRYFLDLHDGPIPDLPAVIWRTIVQEKIVYGFLSPMYVNSILTHSSWQNASWKPRVLCLAGQLIKKGVLDIIGKLCDAVDVNYGITENNLVSTHRITDPTSYVEGCAGYPGYEVMVKVVDRNRCEVPKGTKGEILIWSPALCEGYLNNETANESAFTRDGWFCTDDAGYVGDDGKLYVEGRQSDSILRGAYILYPGWLETKMREFPGVKDIAVVAVPDKVLYHEICACVVVSGIKGVVPGVSVDSLSNHSDQMTSSSSCDTGDEVDNTAFIRNNIERNNILLSSGMQDEVSAYSGSKFPHHFNHTEHIVDPKLDGSPGSLDKIRTEGGNKSLSVSYNETKVRTENIPVVNETQTGKTGTTHREINVDGEVSPDLIRFEKELREFTNNLELLHEKDAMRMVPKHYIFTDAFPLTSTGKISRKEIRRIAASALGLDE